MAGGGSGFEGVYSARGDGVGGPAAHRPGGCAPGGTGGGPLNETGPKTISEDATRFINRLSDWLYMAARWANVSAGVEEALWKPSIEK